MTPDQADQLLILQQYTNTELGSQTALLAASQGYIMHLHELASWLVFLVVIFGLAFLVSARPRRIM